MRMLKGKFDMQDFLEQISVIQQLGIAEDILQKMPMFGLQIPEGANIDDGELIKIKAMISSMTIDERRVPERFIETSWNRCAGRSGQGTPPRCPLLREPHPSRRPRLRSQKKPR